MPKGVRSQFWWSEQQKTYILFIDGIPSNQEFTREWLASVPSFSFRSRDGGQYTLRKQTGQRGSPYWYGYRRLHGRLVKRYIGKTANLSIARLEEVAHQFADVSSSPDFLSPSSFSSKEIPSCTPEMLLLFSKVSPPRLPSLLVEREALLARLDTGLLHTFTLLQAPAGFGKTTLAAQWIDKRRSSAHFPQVVWLSLDASDNDPFRFWRTLITACQSRELTIGQTALALLDKATEPPFQVPLLEGIIASFLHDLAHLETDRLFILDDYHTITESRIHASMTFFLDHLPTKMRVFLLSRTEPPLPLLRWRAKGVLFEVHGADLRFSFEETVTFLRLAHVSQLSEALLHQLDAQLAGWVTGLRLLALTLQRKPIGFDATHVPPALADASREEPGGPHFSEVHQQILDYFVTEILQVQSEDVQSFLLQTSMLEHLNASLCNAIIGGSDGAAQLKKVEQAGLFLEAVGNEEHDLPQGAYGWYRYHTLWASALRREARTRLDEGVLCALFQRASCWYEQQGMWIEAVDAAMQARDLQRAALLIEHADAQGQLSEPHTVHRWLSPMPKHLLSSYPMLCWLCALSLSLLEGESPRSTAVKERGEILLSMAEEGWRQQEALAFLGLIDALQALSAWKKGQFSDAVVYAQQALALFGDSESHRRIRMFRGICLFIIGASHMYAGQFGKARSTLLDAYTCSLTDGVKSFARSMLLLLGICSDTLGDLHQAHEYYQQAIAGMYVQEDHELFAQAKLGLARILLEWNDLTAGERQVQEVMVLAQEGDTDLRHQATFQAACFCYARGNISSAWQQFTSLQVHLQLKATPLTAHMLPRIRLWQARCVLDDGDFEQAQRLVDMLDPQEHIEAQIFQARLKLAKHQPVESCQLLLSLLPQTHGWRQALEIQILLALAYAACQKHQQAQEYLRQALSKAHREHFLRPFLSEGEPLIDMLRQLLPLLREQALHSYALMLLHEFHAPDGADANGTPSPTYSLIEPLSPQEQRVLRLLVRGYSNQEIAQTLVLSIHTVKDHMKQYLKMMTNMPISHPLRRPAAWGELRPPLLLAPLAKGRSYFCAKCCSCR